MKIKLFVTEIELGLLKMSKIRTDFCGKISLAV